PSTDQFLEMLVKRGGGFDGKDAVLDEVRATLAANEAAADAPADLSTKGLQDLLQRQSRKRKQLEAAQERANAAAEVLEQAKAAHAAEIEILQRHQDSFAELDKYVKAAQAKTVIPDIGIQADAGDPASDLQWLEMFSLFLGKGAGRFGFDVTELKTQAAAKVTEVKAKIPEPQAMDWDAEDPDLVEHLKSSGVDTTDPARVERFMEGLQKVAKKQRV
ncbi:unnamed protein product, partial [Prorocentrum cordatum]